ncbi:unnamed protein product [Ectocarpus sp. 12 AP-2014]
MLDFLALGYWVQIFLLSSAFPRTEETEEALGSANRISYDLNCEGETPVLDPHECGLMAEKLTNVERMWDSEADLDASVQAPLFFLYVEAAAAMICGAIGLWGVFASHARAAKWYLWTWLPRLLVGLVMTAKSPVAQTFLYPLGLFLFPSGLIRLLYNIKMVWSYQEVLKRRIDRAPPSESGSARNVGGDVELNASRRGDDPGSSTHLI